MSRQSRHLSRPAQLAVLVVALLGLFAMHGLATHGAMHSPSSGDRSMAGMAIGSSHGAQESGPGDQGAGSASGHDSPDDESMLMALCLALLATALTSLLIVRARGRRRIWLRPPAGTAYPALWLAARRDRDPPCLHALSIQRC